MKDNIKYELKLDDDFGEHYFTNHSLIQTILSKLFDESDKPVYKILNYLTRMASFAFWTLRSFYFLIYLFAAITTTLLIASSMVIAFNIEFLIPYITLKSLALLAQIAILSVVVAANHAVDTERGETILLKIFKPIATAVIDLRDFYIGCLKTNPYYYKDGKIVNLMYANEFTELVREQLKKEQAQLKKVIDNFMQKIGVGSSTNPDNAATIERE